MTLRTSHLLFFILFPSFFMWGQEISISGNVIDENKEPFSFVTVTVSAAPEEDELDLTYIKATSTDDNGNFLIEGLAEKSYIVSFTYIGYKRVSEIISLRSDTKLDSIILQPETETLDETVIVVKNPTIKKEPGKLIFNVENSSVSIGSTIDLLKKTPGVIVQGNNIQLINTTPTIYINNKRVYLSSSELISLLNNTDAGIVKSVEVITNPSAKYDAESGSVLNIITSKAISIGYKGNVNGTYEQGTYAKYRLGTSHFYKNNKVNLYAGYTFSPRKEIKEDDSYIHFLTPNASSSLGSRNSDFTRITRANAHQGNIVADYKVNDKHQLGMSVNLHVSPNKRFENNSVSENYNAATVLDSTYTTQSFSNIDTSNLAFNLNHTWQLSDAGAHVQMDANYIMYDNERLQDVATTFFDDNDNFIRDTNFSTIAKQESDIATVQLDFSIPALSGTIETGLKYSTIATESGLDFYDINNQSSTLNTALSDLFMYDENIYAAYVSYAKDWDKLSLNVGVRGEQTNVTGNSQSLGIVNDQEYFELFPKFSLDYAANKDNSYGVSYARSISRPRYESLNPFRYFVNEFNFADGNPNLQPAIKSKYTLSYTHKNTWFFEAYYIDIDNPFGLIAFQDNEAKTLQSLDVNLINELQYSVDIVYVSSVTSWWYFQMVTSSFYLENEFYALASPQQTQSVNTYGFYGQLYSGLTLSKTAGLTSDITAVYISDFLYGAALYKNQFNTSISFRKSLWDKRASISMGVDDVFNTSNIPLKTRYLNQDNGFMARPESRLFRVGFKYNFGNARLRDNNRKHTTAEGKRLN